MSEAKAPRAPAAAGAPALRDAGPAAASPAIAPDAPAFEDALARLETLVKRLDGGELPLEQSLALFEEGVALARGCAERLESAERRIELLLREGEALRIEPFEPGDGGDASGGAGAR
jgi:exodeoxyribonuclease VII small subunit